MAAERHKKEKEEIARLEEENNALLGQIQSERVKCCDGTFTEIASAEMQSLGPGGFREIRQLSGPKGGHKGKIYSMAWGVEGGTLLTAGQEGKLILWDTYRGIKRLAVTLESIWVMSCGISPSGTMLASGGLDNHCTLHRLEERDGVMQVAGTPSVLRGHDGLLSGCSFFDDSRIVTCSGDRTAAIWDVTTGKMVSKYDDHSQELTSVSLSSDKNTFLTSSLDGTVKMFDARKPQAVRSIPHTHKGDVNSVKYFPDYNAYATCGEDGAIFLFDLRADQMMSAYAHSLIDCGVGDVAFSKSGRLLFSGNYDGKIVAWDTLRAEITAVVETAHEKRISSLDISSDGEALCSASWDYGVKIWQAM